MTTIRRPAVAGSFYPADDRRLREMIAGFMSAVVETNGGAPKAVIAPHAGYIYSGPIAASAYARLAAGRDVIRRIVLLGPAHRLAVRGLAASSADAFATPLGNVQVDRAAVQAILDLPQVQISDEAHHFEHCLEVHLPFLQTICRDFTIVPLLVGAATAEEVAEVLDRLWDGPETRIVVSSDLSHYHDYAAARRLDAATAEAIVALDPAALGRESACGREPIRGLLLEAQRHRLTARIVDLRNSGDTAGPRDQVVGYGAFVFSEPEAN